MLLNSLQSQGQPRVRAKLGDSPGQLQGSDQSRWLVTPHFHVTGVKNMNKRSLG